MIKSLRTFLCEMYGGFLQKLLNYKRKYSSVFIAFGSDTAAVLFGNGLCNGKTQPETACVPAAGSVCAVIAVFSIVLTCVGIENHKKELIRANTMPDMISWLYLIFIITHLS